jgi:hypothetical protein
MRRAGGTAQVSSAPGHGTRIELRWCPVLDAHESVATPTDPEQLVARLRFGFGVGLIVLAVVVVVVTAPYSLTHTGHPILQLLLAGLTVGTVLTAIPGIRGGNWRLASFGRAALFGVTAAQSALLATDQIGGQAHWAYGAIGWFMVLLLLGLATRTAVMILLLYWLLTATVYLLRVPTPESLVDLGLSTASLFGVQLFALLFNAPIREAAAEVHFQTVAAHELATQNRVTQALQADYSARYADHLKTVIPLLTALGRGEPVTEHVQRRARTETRRMRALFDEATTSDHPMLRALRPVVNAADPGIDVTVTLQGQLPRLAEIVISDLLQPVTLVMNAAPKSVRVVITGTPEEVTLSTVVTGVDDCVDLASTLIATGDGCDVITTGDSVWVVNAHRPTPATSRQSAQGCAGGK